jgi:hypothetical protein
MPVDNPTTNLSRFRQTLTAAVPPSGLAPALEALWWEAKGEWTKAHEIAQAYDDESCAWVHAYLHRVEGDLGNAGYWYRRAKKPPAMDPLKDEWAAMTDSLLAKSLK